MATIVSSGSPLSGSSLSAGQSVIVDGGAETISAIDSGSTASDTGFQFIDLGGTALEAVISGAAQMTQAGGYASLAATIARHHDA
jgi:hypothetical protein